VEPTEEPTVEPTEEPTAEPTEEPTAEPTEEPTVEPTEEPTAEPTEEPTVEPTEEPTAEPTEEPTVEPTATLTPTVEIIATATTTPTMAAQGDIGAQAWPTLSTIVYVLNTSSSDNPIGITWYNDDGSEAAATSATLVGNGRGTYQYPGTETSWRGSAVVSSEQPVVAGVLTTDDPSSSSGITSGYTGSDSGATLVFLPTVHRWPGTGWETLISVQNVGSGPADIEIKIRQESTVIKTISDTIQVSASHHYDLVDYTDIPSDFSGSATVESTNSQPLYVVVHENWAPTQGLVSYEGFLTNDVGTKLYVPAMNRTKCENDSCGWLGALLVQNTHGTAQANIEIKFLNADGTPAHTVNDTLDPYESGYYTTWNYPSQSPWSGSATAESLGTSPPDIAVLFTYGYGWYGTRGATAWGRGVVSGDDTIYAPVVQGNISGGEAVGRTCSMFIQNLDSSDADYTVTFYNNDGSTQETVTGNILVGGRDYVSTGSYSTLWSFDGSLEVTTLPDGESIAGVLFCGGPGGKHTHAGWPKDPNSITNLLTITP
jgi:hypothetical protein